MTFRVEGVTGCGRDFLQAVGLGNAVQLTEGQLHAGAQRIAFGGSGKPGFHTVEQRQQVTELDPFWLIGFDYAPYRQLGATLRRDLTAQLSVGVGADVRRLRDSNDERGFNREFERYFVDVGWNDLFVRGLSLSFAGPLTYPKNDALRAAAAFAPADRIVVETDAPFLPPQRRRGQRNEPAYVVETLAVLAEVRQLSLADAAALTFANATALFG